MSLSREDVRAIAREARIGLSEDEIDEMKEFLEDAIVMLEPILEYDLEGVEPLSQPEWLVPNQLRDDIIEPGLSIEAALSNTPETRGRYVRVPPILNPREEI